MGRHLGCAECPGNFRQERQILRVACEHLRFGRQVWIDVAAGPGISEILGRLLRWFTSARLKMRMSSRRSRSN